MSFGTPSSDTGTADYSALVTHSSGVKLRISSVITETGSFDPGDMDTAWTAAIALLDADADFTYQGGDKTYSTHESFTL